MRFAITLLLLCLTGCEKERTPEEKAAEAYVEYALAKSSSTVAASESTATPPVNPYVATEPASPPAQSEFHGYSCTQDCSGHEAGYAWAEENGIEDPDDCGGNSESFIEGCRAWAEEQEPEPSSASEESGDSSADPDGY